MARFGRDFVRAATQPAFTQGLFTAAAGLGSAPRRRREEERQMKLFDEISKATGQAQASAVAGDPNALALNINKLEALRDAAPTLKEKQTIDARITQLRNLTGAAEAKGLTRDINAVSQIDNTLKTLDTSTEQGKKVKEALESRKVQLLQNPEIEQGYRQAQVDQFQFDQQELAMRESKYIRENAGAFISAVESGDQETIDSILEQVPQEFKASVDKYITGSMQNNKIKQEFEANSIEQRTAPMTDQELQDIVDQLPENVRNNVAPLVQEYKNASKGWNSSKGEWNTAELSKAKNAEKALRARVATLTDQSLLRELDTERDQEIRTERDILRLELSLEAPLDRNEVKDEEMRLTGQNKDKITPEITEQARQNVRSARDAAIIDQIAILSETRATEIAEERSPYTKGEIVPDGEGGFYRFEGGDYRDSSNYTKITSEEAGVVSDKGDSLQEILELFRLKEENNLPIDKVDDYIAAFLKYGNPERARRKLGNNEG